MINESSRQLYRSAQAVWYILFVVEGLLAVRFGLQLLQANADALFTSLIYTVSNVLVLPFATVFSNASVATSVFEWTTLLAMFIYWLLAMAIIQLLIMSKPVSTIEADKKLVE